MKNILLSSSTMFFIVGIFFVFANSVEQSRTLWVETSYIDFANGILENVTITSTDGGEVVLTHPMVKVVQDYQDETHQRVVAYDKRGNYLRVWVENSNLYAQRFRNDGVPIEARFFVSTVIGRPRGKKVAAFLDDGHFCIGWLERGPQNDLYDQLAVQVFDSTANRIGPTFKLDNSSVVPASYPCVLGDDNQRCFWFLFSGNTGRIFRQKLSIDPLELAAKSPLNDEPTGILEHINSVASNGIDKIAVAWTGANNGQIYVRLFDTNFNPISASIEVNDNNGFNVPSSPSVAFGRAENLLVAWSDNRDLHDWINWFVYAQLLDTGGKKVGSNFKVSEECCGNAPEILHSEDVFEISWGHYDQIIDHFFSGLPDKTFLNRWQISPVFSGEYLSSVFDTGPSGTSYEVLKFEGLLPEATQLRLQLRSSNDSLEIKQRPWFGPTGAIDFYDGENVSHTPNSIHEGDRYIQYRALFATDSIGVSAALQSTAITFSTLDTIPPVSPSGVVTVAGHAQVTIWWQPNPEQDIWKYRLYRRLENQTVDSSWTREILPPDTSFIDTSAVTRKKYFYTLTAVDFNHNESLPSQEVHASPFATTLWVDDNSTGGDGSFASPFSTITEALSRASLFDTIKVLPGEYEESVTIDRHISLIGSGAKVTILKSTNTRVPLVELRDANLVRGFKILSTADLEFIALKVSRGAPIITENIFIGEGSGFSIGIDVDSDSCFIHKNFISGFSTAIFLWTRSPRFLSRNNVMLVRNNVIYNPKSALAGIVVRHLTNLPRLQVSIENNTIVLEKGRVDGIRYAFSESAPGAFSGKFRNNIIVAAVGTGFACARTQNNSVEVAYNNAIVLGDGIPFSGCDSGMGNISEDPLFVDAVGLDFQLSTGSPSVDAGISDDKYNDLDGTRNDMGAFGGADPIDPDLISVPFISVQVGKLSGRPGDTLSVAISVNNASKLAKAVFTLEFDPQLLTFQKVKTTSLTSNFDLSFALAKDDQLNIRIFDTKGIQSGKGALVLIDFVINTDAPAGVSSSLVLTDVSLQNALNEIIDVNEIHHGGFSTYPVGKNGPFIYVSADAEDGGDGSMSQPFERIGDAVEASTPGDTIFVGAGTYAEAIELNHELYLIGAGALVTKIEWDDPFQFPTSSVISILGVDGGSIEGFTLSGLNLLSEVIDCNRANVLISHNRILCGEDVTGVSCNQSSPLISENAFVSQTATRAIGIYSYNSTPRIKNNTFTFDGELCVGVANSGGSSATIVGNIFSVATYGVAILNSQSSHASRQNRIFLRGPDSRAFSDTRGDSSLISNNIIRGERENTVGLNIDNGSYVEITNNIFDTGQYGINAYADSILVNNNIILGNLDYGVQLAGSYKMTYNAFWQNQRDCFSCTPGEGHIFLEPLFIDRVRGDYRLSASSPCMNAGNPACVYNDPDGSRNDMGAYGGSFALANELSNLSLSFPSVQVAPGDTIILTMNINNGKGLAFAQFTLGFDSNYCRILNAWPGAIAAGFTAITKDSTAGSQNFFLLGNRGLSQGNGTLAKVQVAISSEIDTELSITIRFDQINLKNEFGSQLAVSHAQNAQLDVLVTSVTAALESGSPLDFVLFLNYPNPFNPVTIIKYGISKDAKVSLQIFNILGEEVSKLVDERQTAGYYQVQWDASRYSSGVYFYRIQAGRWQKVGKMTLLQ